MAYRWSLEGPGFEFPTPYATENRFLRLRAYALVLLALAVVATTLLAGNVPDDAPLIAVEDQPLPGSAWPHLLMALLIAVLGVLDFLQLARQRTLMLVPGQPEGLIAQVRSEGNGTSAGAAWLLRTLGQGQVQTPPGDFVAGGWLPGGGRALALAPNSVQAYRQTRLSNLALGGGLLVVLAFATVALNGRLLNRPAGLSLVALTLLLVAVAAAARQVLDASKAALSPLKVLAVLALTVLACAPMAWWGDRLPRAAGLPQLGLPWAAATVLLVAWLSEALGWLAARANPDLPAPRSPMTGDELSLQAGLSPALLLSEVDLELHRRWQDGVPSRRYCWQHSVVDGNSPTGAFTASVIEESQPQPGGPVATGSTPGQLAGRARQTRLLLLGVLALVASLGGALLWLWMTWLQMAGTNAAWTRGAVGLGGLLAGVHALRVAHLLWSRVEVDSQLTWLEFDGLYARQDGPAGVALRPRGDAPVRLETLTIRACVARARSVFYAAAGGEIGGRRLLGVEADAAAAALWTQLVDDLVRSADEGGRPASAGAPSQAPSRPRDGREARNADALAGKTAHRSARFCSACGSPVLAAARFCQQCGHTLMAD
jgi:hypothetical protein